MELEKAEEIARVAVAAERFNAIDIAIVAGDVWKLRWIGEEEDDREMEYGFELQVSYVSHCPL